MCLCAFFVSSLLSLSGLLRVEIFADHCSSFSFLRLRSIIASIVPSSTIAATGAAPAIPAGFSPPVGIHLYSRLFIDVLFLFVRLLSWCLSCIHFQLFMTVHFSALFNTRRSCAFSLFRALIYDLGPPTDTVEDFCDRVYREGIFVGLESAGYF